MYFFLNNVNFNFILLVEQVPVAPIEECGTNPDLLVFYRSNIIISVTGLTVKPSDDVVQSGTDVIFSVTHETGDDVDFTIDYGDGSYGTFTYVHEALVHKYFVPGKYWIQVSAKPKGAPEVCVSITFDFIMYIFLMSKKCFFHFIFLHVSCE